MSQATFTWLFAFVEEKNKYWIYTVLLWPDSSLLKPDKPSAPLKVSATVVVFVHGLTIVVPLASSLAPHPCFASTGQQIIKSKIQMIFRRILL